MPKCNRLIFSGLAGIVLAVGAGLTACGAPQTPSVPVVSTSTQPPVAATAVRGTSSAPTATARPATTTPTQEATALPTALPEQPTRTAPVGDGGMNFDFPQLIFPTTNGLMAVAADGTQLRLLIEAQPVVMHNLKDGIAPFSGLLAFISGDNPMTPDSEGSGPLSLDLLFSYGGGVTSVTPLFSIELEQAIRSATSTGDRNDAIEAAIAIIDNADTRKWSPDGRYLAFIAAIDGPSSDVYSYDRESRQIKRLTDGLNQAARLFWSPDSQWIVHEEVASFGTGAGWSVIAVWAAAPDGSGNRKLYNAGDSGDEVFVDWVTPDTFLVYSWTPMGWKNVRLVNLATGEAQRVGPDFPVQTLAYDPKTRAQLYYGDDYVMSQRGLQGGLYLATPATIGQPRFVTAGDWYDTRWLPQAQLFFAKGKAGVISVTLDGVAGKFDAEQNIPIDAPDGAWLLAWSNGEFISQTGLRLYTPDGILARTITDKVVTLALWSPDSTGAFYASAGALHYVSIPDGEPQVIAEKLISAELASYVWVMP